ncbi:MAG: PqiC family protein [Acidobacteriota bacterium]|nr:PqiC family protein [Acidobacteriota bacterium]
MTIRRTIPILLPLLLAGCSFLSSKPSRFYALDRIPPQYAVVSVRGLPIGVDVVLPPGLNRKEVVVRQIDHQLDVRGREQWTATLEPLVLHTLAFDLASRLPDGMVILPGQAKPDGGMRSLDVVVEELAAGPDRAVVLDARWTLREAGRPDITRSDHIAIDIGTLDSANIATGISRAIATLADHIVTQLR